MDLGGMDHTCNDHCSGSTHAVLLFSTPDNPFVITQLVALWALESGLRLVALVEGDGGLEPDEQYTQLNVDDGSTAKVAAADLRRDGAAAWVAILEEAGGWPATSTSSPN